MSTPGPAGGRAGAAATAAWARLKSTGMHLTRAAATLAGASQRRASPRLAAATILGASALSLTMVITAAAWPSSHTSSSRWVAHVAEQAPPTAEPAPPQQPVRPLAVRPQRSPTAPLPPPPPAGNGDGGDGEFVTWAIADSRGITGSSTLADTSTTASMIKVWLVADYLRQHDDPSQERLNEFSSIVRDSNNELSQELFTELGAEQSIHRLISTCGLTDSRAVPGFWSNTRLSGRDTARMGTCIADGRAAGPQWTGWLLDEMRQVRGVGDFGIRDALPEPQRSQVAIKNGWVIREDANEWHVNCLAIGDGWSMGVLVRYPVSVGYEGGGHAHGAEICRSLAEQHLDT